MSFRSLEQAYIGSQLGDRDVNTEHWIGLSKGDKGDSYSWTSGEHVAYTNWDQTHSGNGEYVCVAITVSGKTAGKWADRACSQTKSYICEYPRKGYQQNKVGTTPRPPACPLEHYWRGYGDYCYKRVFGRQTWFQAWELCKNLGGDLASFHSQRQMNEAADVPQYASGYRDNFWIGLHKPTKNSSYVWTDGSALDYTNWDEGEPNDHNGLESCVELNRGQRGLWNDANCYTLKQCICQVKRGDPVYTSMSTPATTKAPHCGNDTNWLSHGDYCYYLSLRYGRGAQLPWHDAKIYCIQNGGDLISIHSVDENNFLISQAYDSRQFWIGLNALDFESYKWSDGSVLDFLAWDVNQPTNLYGGQRCATFSKLTGNWGNENCGEYKNYICKRHKDTRTTVAPTPTPVILGGCPTGFQGIAFLTTVLKDKTLNYWIGLSIQWVGYKRRYRRFRWADNSKIDYANWDFGEPSGTSYTPKEDCVAVASKGNSIGRWRDHGCNVKMGYICQTWKDPNLPTSQAPTQAGSLCPTGYESFGSACYQLTSPMTWEEANVTCEGQQDSLVSILDPHEQAFLVLMMHRNDTQPVWIGLHRNRSSFEWVDGWLVNYVNWNAREPSRNTGDYCVLLDTNGRWNDTVCYRKFRAICKKTSVRPPTPTAEIPGTCPDATWHPYGSYCYFMSKGYAMWAGGIFQCHKKGATLASISDQGEMDFILRTVREQLITVDLWIGLYRNIDGSLRWYDGTPINYENWGIGQPSSEKDMDCVYAAKGRGDWQAGRCGLAIGYICKVPKDGAEHIWSDSTETNFTNWDDGQPDNHNGMERCVGMFATTGKWRDENCASARGWICKVPLGATTVSRTTEGTSIAGNICGDNWHSFGDNCYFYSHRWGDPGRESWRSSRKWCLKNAGDLLNIQTPEEADFITALIGRTEHAKLWIGANNVDLNGYKWTDGTPVNNINWAKNEPNSKNGDQRCINIYTGKENIQAGTFNDDNCGDKLPFICKRHVSSRTTGTMPQTSLIPGHCPVGFEGVGNRCYKFVGVKESDRKNYTDAKAACAAMGKTVFLASITNSFEQAFVTSRVQDTDVNYWIGLSDYDRQHFFRWLTNEDLTYTNWDTNEPTNFFVSQGENCVQVQSSRDSAGKWADDTCSKRYGYICQTWKDPSIKTPWTTQSTVRVITCPEDYSTLDGRTCFKLYTDPRPWRLAHRQCTTDRAYLAYVPDAVQKAGLMTFLIQSGKLSVWLGLKDMGRQRFKWVNNWPLQYTNWDKNEPSAGVAEACGVMAPDGKWKNELPSPTESFASWCPESGLWREYDTSCFYFDAQVRQTWAHASFECFKRGGHLASFSNQDEVDYIIGLLRYESRPEDLWIGLVRRFENDTFTWYDGKTVGFTNWSPGEPTHKDGEQACAVFLIKTGQWRATSCTDRNGFICKAPANIPATSHASGKPSTSPAKTHEKSSQAKSGGAASPVPNSFLWLILCITTGVYYNVGHGNTA
ncbi:macrophage mannose receptor 1-like [Lingula anatina]|uniref:Macrophage mannose receptor 1-like n=1 Tax=Lingula anatina TaxID=7574 RepID=A0A2R2MTJ0_LINAN|nr:macrophage mannose receptor 1-like [Lingula anatina]|eukprot:XP_023933559.1 macrophage mannose receptor 1-like [Lingula anatina]